jgi:hypothetical protein
MLLILRKMKQSYFGDNEFRKYLLYALGEMVLVVVGILIALQIDNWNSDKLQQETLRNYLHTIERNIGSDRASINEIHSARIRTLELGLRWANFGGRRSLYNVSEMMFAGEVIDQASTLRHFNASSSGYEALKSSGALEQMQGTDIERLLYDYYDTIARIAAQEKDFNDLTRMLSLQVLSSWPDEFERWEMTGAITLTAERFESLEPAYRKVLQASTTKELILVASSANSLLREYDKLDHLGKAFQRLLEIDSMELDATAMAILEGVHDPGSGVGDPDVIVDGQVSWKSHYLMSADANDPRVSHEAFTAGRPSPYNINSFQRIGNSLHIDYYGGAAWAGIWFGSSAISSDRRGLDYSSYDTLLLELKGDAGGEKILINIEDAMDPPDGTSTRRELQLSDSWQTYEIDLAEFETADLSILFTAVGFVFLEEPVAFSIRTARFVKEE